MLHSATSETHTFAPRKDVIVSYFNVGGRIHFFGGCISFRIDGAYHHVFRMQENLKVLYPLPTCIKKLCNFQVGQNRVLMRLILARPLFLRLHPLR
jgi:hypothetical protein